jgi:CheY-like chemotaxis protein/HPt (histidine-containing phosphotransfer) domain-containing protein/anti-sigma regulatory factor (Ser/Thr protein kinase)
MTGLLLDTRLTQEQREFVDTIAQSTSALLNIINEILDFSKIEAGKLTLEVIDFDLREAVEGTVEMLAESAQKKSLELLCWLDLNVPTQLRGDPGRLRQVLANLLGNAIKFTEDGEVLVNVSLQEETENRAVLRFAVNDTGIGISAKAMPLIFQAFTQADGSTTRKYGGTGLGLTISKQLVDLMQGEMGVESAEGKGSTFWFRLPLEKQPQASAPLPPPQAGRLEGRRVLVVDETETHRRCLHLQLSHWQMSVSEATSEATALEMLRVAAAEGNPFELVLFDAKMPNTEELSLAQAIQADLALASTRLVAFTTLGHRLTPTLMQALGISACVMKPLRLARLLDCLVEVVSAASKGPIGLGEEGFGELGPSLPGLARHVRILLAEDNLVNQRVALKQLKKLGYQADAVANGTEVLAAFKRAPYDIVLMDCQMPGVDGYEATRQIRQWEKEAAGSAKPPAYIVALTAHTLEGDREKCLAAGMNDYVTKPLHLSDLQTVLQRALLDVKPAAANAAAPAPDEVLDRAVIAGLRELREPNQPDPLRELTDLFLKDAKPRIEKMEAGLNDKDLPRLVSAAHSLKGSASNLGARRLAALCASLEKQAKAGELAEAAQTLGEVKKEFDLVQETLLTQLDA